MSQSHKIMMTADGSNTVVSALHNELYHSKHGSIVESKHVFIQEGLQHFIKTYSDTDIAVLEIGFGTGLNALLTRQWALEQQYNISYTSLEKYPVPMSVISQLNYADLTACSQTFFEDIHHCAWEVSQILDETFSICKRQMDFHALSEISKFNVIFYDAFAPSAQPDLWEAVILDKMFVALKGQGILVTYCAKGSFKRALKEVGFEVESIPGPPGKREMTRAVKL